MVNTGKSFIEKSLMLRIVDGLSYNKMNVLHWRLADKMNFPLDLNLSIKAWFDHISTSYFLHFTRPVTGNWTRALDILLFLKMLRTAVLAVRNTPLTNIPKGFSSEMSLEVAQ